MGHAARANPRSFDGKASAASVYHARLERFCAFFATREEYEAYLTTAGVTDRERGLLEVLLPVHLKAQGSV